MHVLFVTNRLDVGGVEMNLMRLARVLIRLGHDVTVASAGGTLESELAALGGVNVPIALALRSPRLLRQDICTIEALFRSGPPDVVHVFSASSAILIAIVRRLARCRGVDFPPVVSAIMGLAASPDEQPAVTLARAWATSLGADVLLTISPAIEAIVRRLPIARQRVRRRAVVGIELHEPSLNGARRRALRAQLHCNRDTKLVLTAGNLEPRKSHELFVAAAAHVAAGHAEARFVIVGEGSLRHSLAKQVDQLGLGGVVELIGERVDLDDLLRCTDVYVRPGVVEGFIGITVLQAQAACVPVVSFDTQDVRMAIEHGITGWLVPAGDVRGLADAVSRLLQLSPADWRSSRRRVAKPRSVSMSRSSVGRWSSSTPSFARRDDRHPLFSVLKWLADPAPL